jgi:methionyl-tRNA formyltransferase
MKALLVTSRVTFVPRNYDDLVVGMAACPRIGGLLVLDNADLSLVARAVGLAFAGAPRTGATILANLTGPSARRRERAWARQGKPVFHGRSVNARAVVRLVGEHGFDLIVNARTRQIFRRRILRAPRLGCINVHHGLLPGQRGTTCDLRALAEGRPAGFSIHGMTPAVDAGPILARVRVSPGDDRDYAAYLVRAARAEVGALEDVLARIEAADAVEGRPNVAPAGAALHRTPTRREIAGIRRKGVRL